MNQLQSARLANAKAVLHMMDEYAAHWSNRSAIQVKLDRLRSLATSLDAGDAKQRNTQPMGFTGRRNEAFAALHTTTYGIAVKLKDWASETHNTVLYQATRFSASELRAASSINQLGMARLVLSKATEALKELAGYDIQPENLASFESQIKAAEELAMDRAMMESRYHLATGKIRDNSRELLAVLTALDDLMNGFNRAEDVEFVNAYHQVRKSMARRSRTKATAPKEQPQKVEGGA